jgi:hypothetical protein
MHEERDPEIGLDEVPVIKLQTRRVSEPLSSRNYDIPRPTPMTRSSSAPLSTCIEGEISAEEKTSLSSVLLAIIPPNLVRHISRTQPVVTFYCSICLENHPLEEIFAISSCQQKHRFCASSLKSFATCQINDGILEYRCPLSSEGCNGLIAENELQVLLDAEVFEKYSRFKAMKQNTNYRECPKCATPVVGNPQSSHMVCISCQEQFCFFHSNAHPGRTCEDYNASQARSEMQSKALIKSLTVPCPNCHIETEKSGGCNHMTCRQCGQVRN